ncbi:hypothetical protein [Haematomicrobium sanguinis]|uniref:hypothetical protein n=1 Tax=Haematomicrobium sanguinis TaxID=479106 RepID=UPI00054E92BE|nr:hypothetical protein [Haematomicrobium sanguinis]
MSENTPPRVRVTAPPSARTNHAPATLRDELDEHSPVADAVVRSLIRTQFRLAAVVAIGFLVLLLSVPILTALFPDISALTIAGIPLPWILLGFLAYPLTIASGYLFYRAAARNERRFNRLTNE